MKTNFENKFAGPCAQGVLDPLIVPRPMSLGRPGLFVLIKDYAFLRASAHESVLTAGYSLNSRCGSRRRQTLAGLHGVIFGNAGANLGPICGQLGACLHQTNDFFAI